MTQKQIETAKNMLPGFTEPKTWQQLCQDEDMLLPEKRLVTITENA